MAIVPCDYARHCFDALSLTLFGSNEVCLLIVVKFLKRIVILNPIVLRCFGQPSDFGVQLDAPQHFYSHRLKLQSVTIDKLRQIFLFAMISPCTDWANNHADKYISLYHWLCGSIESERHIF